ncbi:MAG: hypothetical protein ACF8AM_20065, partial [Rhodopirellula sp. JB055]|uniref:hypothetical protein n=1 Tax=Rhodopirellula sp. JB055 TaxID=3342846 RepID=UPI00370A4800
MQQSLKSIAQQLDDHEDEKPSMPTYAARTWSTLDRKYTTVATLVEFDGENALIKNADGKESFVPKSKLIAEDRVYLDSILEATQHFESWRATGIELATELAKTKATLDLGIGPKPQKPDLASIDKELIDAEKRRIAAAETLRIEAAAKAKADKLNQAKKNAAEELELFATILA